MSKKKILVIILCILAPIGILTGIYISKDAQKSIETVENIITEEIDRIEETENNANTVQNTVKENKSTTTIEDLTEKEEQALEEQETEDEAFELQRKYSIQRR